MSSVLRRLPLQRLLLACGVVVAVGIGGAALALAVAGGPVPPPKPLPEAIHDALSAPPVEGVSARIQLINHLLEGSSLASGSGEASQLASSPLVSGASGRLWIGSGGHARLELQSEKGDTQLLWDGHTASMYDASTNTLYRYVPPQHEGGASGPSGSGGAESPGSGGAEPANPAGAAGQTPDHKAPTAAEIQERIEDARRHADISEATPADVAGQAAYTVRVSPREDGGLIAGAELSWDVVHGVPLRAAVYSTESSSPVLELAATEVSYGPIDPSTLDFTPPSSAKVKDVTLPEHSSSGGPNPSGGSAEKPHVTVHGKGLGAIVLAESPVNAGSTNGSGLEGLRKVDINGASASELPTALGTILSFERTGVHYLVAGSVTPTAIEAFARTL